MSPPTLAAIYEAHFDYVYWSLRRLGVLEADLEDLAHETFMTVHRRLADYDITRPIRPWLFGIAYRVASDYRRSARRRELPSEDLEVVDATPPVDERIASGQAAALVHEALDALDLDQRAVFVMHELDGCSIPEIMQVIPVSPNTLYSRLRLARKHFTARVRQLAARRGTP